MGQMKNTLLLLAIGLFVALGMACGGCQSTHDKYMATAKVLTPAEAAHKRALMHAAYSQHRVAAPHVGPPTAAPGTAPAPAAGQ